MSLVKWKFDDCGRKTSRIGSGEYLSVGAGQEKLVFLGICTPERRASWPGTLHRLDRPSLGTCFEAPLARWLHHITMVIGQE